MRSTSVRRLGLCRALGAGDMSGYAYLARQEGYTAAVMAGWTNGRIRSRSEVAAMCPELDAPTMRQLLDGVPASREQKLMAVFALLRGEVLGSRHELALGVDVWVASADHEQRVRAALSLIHI